MTGARWLTVFLDFPAGSFDAGVAFCGRRADPGRTPRETAMADPTGRRYGLG